MNPPLNLVCFAHGMESGPWGTKIRRLGRIAQTFGFQIESPDYQGMMDPDQRVEKLLALNPSARENLILVGSSMGGYVAAAASESLHPRGLFLMAPAVKIAGFGKRTPAPTADIATAVHGWNDDVVPVENAISFCRSHQIQLHLMNCGHTLIRAMEQVEVLFSRFLEQVVAVPHSIH